MAKQRNDEDMDADAPRDPRCRLCEQRRPGQMYHFWGGVLVSSKEVGSILSNVSHITAKYRNLRKCGVFVCQQCASRMRRLSHLPGAIGWGVACVVLAAVAVVTALRWPIAGVIFGILAAVAALLWVLDLWQVIRPGLDSPRMDKLILNRATKYLRLQGKGDAFFTEAEYRSLFRKDPSYAESAEDILAAEDEEVPTPRRRKARRSREESTKSCQHCGGKIPSYAQACPLCKKILA